MRKNQENSLKTDKQRLSRSAIIGSVLATIIASSPLLYSLHESVPKTEVWDTFLFTYRSGFWQDSQYAMWVFTGKVLPLILLFIWFFTNRHWWYHVLLVPITMYVFQIVNTYRGDVLYIDENQLLHLLPILVVIVPSIYLIRAKIFNKINYADKTMEELEAEFMIKPKTLWGKIKQYF
ncbi:hypothetical protein ACFQ1Q_00815 [Winogradskyella litorisediminis]|uniref:Uncharacterized protein n=1 Tax=Winogradskyella litorisediminis TaxID=1156618 RepID=A0ABW3N2B8_9FLAO